MFQILDFTYATLASLTTRVEKHGDDNKPAVSMRLEIEAPNTLLDVIDPQIRHALYMAVDGQDQLPGVEPATPVLRCNSFEKHALVAAFLAKHYGGNETPGTPMDKPISTITTQDHHHLVTSHLAKLRGTSNSAGTAEPLGTVSAQGQHHAEVRALLLKYYGTDQDPQLGEPLHTVTTKDRFGLVTVAGELYAIADIGMRMLQPRELYRAQGFPDSYQIDRGADGRVLSKAAQVRMCGNSVCPPLARAIVAANYSERQALREAA